MSKKQKPSAGNSVSALTAPASPLSPAISGFQTAKDFALPAGATVKSFSPIIKPADFPVGQVFVGKFTKIFHTREFPMTGGGKKQGYGIEIIPAGAQVGIALPLVATLATAIEFNEAAEIKSPFIGRTVAVQKGENKLKSTKGQDAWNFIVAVYPE